VDCPKFSSRVRTPESIVTAVQVSFPMRDFPTKRPVLAYFRAPLLLQFTLLHARTKYQIDKAGSAGGSVGSATLLALSWQTAKYFISPAADRSLIGMDQHASLFRPVFTVGTLNSFR